VRNTGTAVAPALVALISASATSRAAPFVERLRSRAAAITGEHDGVETIALSALRMIFFPARSARRYRVAITFVIAMR
jgi:hypothetical protein